MKKNAKKIILCCVTATFFANSTLLPASALEFPDLQAPSLVVPEFDTTFSTHLPSLKASKLGELYDMGYGVVTNQGKQEMGEFSIGNDDVIDYYNDNFDSFGDSDWQAFGQQIKVPDKSTLTKNQEQLRMSYSQLSSSMPSAYESSMKAFADQQMHDETAASTFNTALKYSYMNEDVMAAHERDLLEKAGASQEELAAFDQAHYEKTQNRYSNSEEYTRDVLIDIFANDEEAYAEYQQAVLNGEVKDYKVTSALNPVTAAQAAQYGGRAATFSGDTGKEMLDMYYVPRNNIVMDIINEETDGDEESSIDVANTWVNNRLAKSEDPLLADMGANADNELSSPIVEGIVGILPDSLESSAVSTVNAKKSMLYEAKDKITEVTGSEEIGAAGQAYVAIPAMATSFPYTVAAIADMTYEQKEAKIVNNKLSSQGAKDAIDILPDSMEEPAMLTVNQHKTKLYDIKDKVTEATNSKVAGAVAQSVASIPLMLVDPYHATIATFDVAQEQQQSAIANEEQYQQSEDEARKMIEEAELEAETRANAYNEEQMVSAMYE